MKTIAASLLAVALASTGHAQNPIPWPIGSPVPSTIQNNDTVPLPYSWCTPTVTDATGQIVVWGLCLAVELQLPPGETVTTWWDQRDQFGVAVAPGVYHVNGVPFDLGATAAALRPLGAPHPGASRSIALASPNDPNATYLLAAAFSSNFGIPLGCGVTFPLDFDWLLVDSLTNPVVFPGFVGALDADGRSTAPAIVLPPLPVLLGISFDLGFVTTGSATACGWSRTAGPVAVTIS